MNSTVMQAFFDSPSNNSGNFDILKNLYVDLEKTKQFADKIKYLNSDDFEYFKNNICLNSRAK